MGYYKYSTSTHTWVTLESKAEIDQILRFHNITFRITDIQDYGDIENLILMPIDMGIKDKYEKVTKINKVIYP